jgi:HKD family nuclease
LIIVNQPFEGSLGLKLIDNLQMPEYSEFRFIVAYSKTSGINRILPYMQKFKSSGGVIKGVVGIDQGNTSYEALISLLNVCDDLFIYHSEDIMRTFHVKAYYFNGSRKSWLAIGSNNLTAGGLFGNYEASICDFVSNSQKTSFISMFDDYSNTDSPCCKRASRTLIEDLLTNAYVQHEQAIAKERISSVAQQRLHTKGVVLFGRDAGLSSLPVVDANDSNRHTKSAKKVTRFTPAEEQPVDPVSDMDYLIRHVPKAGKRSKQVHFTMEILHDYFHLSKGDPLSIQQIEDIYTPHPIENRQIVYSKKNENVKIEVSAAEILNSKYPTDINKRPILVFKRINPTMFEYMLLLDGADGYTELNTRLLQLNWKYRSLPYEIVNTSTMLSIWKDCPLI